MSSDMMFDDTIDGLRKNLKAVCTAWESTQQELKALREENMILREKIRRLSSELLRVSSCSGLV